MHLTDNFRCNFHAWNWSVWPCAPLSAIGRTMQFSCMKPATCRNLGHFSGNFHAGFMHGFLAWKCMPIPWTIYACFMLVFMHIPCMVPAHSMETCMSMCHSCTFYAQNMQPPCIFHACCVHGTSFCCIKWLALVNILFHAIQYNLQYL